MEKFSFTKREIINVLFSTLDSKTEQDNIDLAIKYILEKLQMQLIDVDDTQLNVLKTSLKTLRSKRNEKWQNVRRIKCKFESKYEDWLNSNFQIPELCHKNVDCPFNITAGRPTLPFHLLSERSKRRKVSEISNKNDNDPSRLLMACRYAAKKSKEKDLVTVLNKIQESPPTKMKKLLEDSKEVKKLSPEKALSYLLDRSLSKDDYISMRCLVKEQGADIFPAYEHLRAAKEQCRPAKDLVSITENEATVTLQGLLNHTAKRIASVQTDVILQYIQTENITEELEVLLMCSWGFDGSSGYSSYKQQYKNMSDSKSSETDENLFVTALIPLRLTTPSNVILWNNRASQSAKSCRPIKMRYVVESANVILEEKERVDKEIDTLETYVFTLETVKVVFHFTLFMTLIDGKVLNIITNTKSMQTCPICHSTPKHFNNLNNIQSEIFFPNPKSLIHGVSPLHAWIRFLECCLNISYRLNIKVWQVRTNIQKAEFARRKSEVQKIMWEKLGLKVDRPKVGGSGTSNDGNTARRAFEKPELLSEYLGLDHKMLSNFQTILIALSTQLPLDPVLFNKLCKSTAELYVKNYSWYPMPQTVHKILIHSAEIIKNSLLPVGILGEEASEACNKYYKKNRHDHSRKNSRYANIYDLFYRSMDISDPVMSFYSLKSRLQKRKHLQLPSEVRSLLTTSKDNSVTGNKYDENIDNDNEEGDFSGLSDFYSLLDNENIASEDQLEDN